MNVFSLFPPETKARLAADVLHDLDINLHAFLINVAGIGDNWAWAYVLRHNIESDFAKRTHIGLFMKETIRRFPEALRKYLKAKDAATWYHDYAKVYRDGLAHGIPAYLPPAQLSPKDRERWHDLESQERVAREQNDEKRIEEVWDERGKLGAPCFLLVTSSGGNVHQVHLHAQMVSDVGFVVEFGELFLQHWNEQPSPLAPKAGGA